MKKMLLLLVPFVLIMIIGCGRTQGDNPVHFTTMPDELKITYGNGEELIIIDADIIKKIIMKIEKNKYKAVKSPDSVGNNFTIQLGNDWRYLSSGYLSNNNSYHKAQILDPIKEMNEYVLSLKSE